MKFLDAIKKSEFILIEGEKKVGKLTFALYEAHREIRKKILIFSTYAKKIINKRVEAINNQNIQEIEEVLQNTKFLSLKENWPELKSKFGIDFLLRDIIRAVEKEKPDFLIFHRFDLFFEPHETGILKTFIEDIVEIKSNFNNKLIFTSVKSESSDSIVENIENFSDINIELEKNEQKRIIKVKNSIFPIDPNICEFLIFNNKIKLLPVNDNFQNSPSENKTYDILIISKNKDLINKLSYIFKHKLFSIDYATKTSEIINKLLSNPDIIIYNPFENELDFSVCHTIKQQKLKSKLIYITNEHYLRSDDKIQAINNGCYDVFPLNFNVLNFISEIEKLLGINIYSSNLSKLKLTHKITNKEMVCNVIKSLLDEKIFFTAVKFHSTIQPNIKLLRNHDFIYQNGNSYILILLNTTKENIPSIFSKLFNKNEYKIEFIFEASDNLKNIEEICKWKK